jgi:hypothetical protein
MAKQCKAEIMTIMAASRTLTANREKLQWHELLLLVQKVKTVLRTLKTHQPVDIDLLPITLTICVKLDAIEQSHPATLYTLLFGPPAQEQFRYAAHKLYHTCVDVLDLLLQLAALMKHQTSLFFR